MIYAVGMRSRRSTARPPGILGGLRAARTDDLPDPGLARVAEDTGGYAEIGPRDDLGVAFARDVESQISIRSRPTMISPA